jgi:hypothetical protein
MSDPIAEFLGYSTAEFDIEPVAEPNETTRAGMATLAERERIAGVWFATSWQFFDAESMTFAHVSHFIGLEGSSPDKPWQLGLSTGSGPGLGLPDRSWYATADEAKAVLSAAVLDLWQKQRAER